MVVNSSVIFGGTEPYFLYKEIPIAIISQVRANKEGTRSLVTMVNIDDETEEPSTVVFLKEGTWDEQDYNSYRVDFPIVLGSLDLDKIEF